MSAEREALRQLAKVCKLVDFADCAERPELWHKLNAAQQVAEEVLRRPEQAQPAPTGDVEQDALLSNQVAKWRKEVARLNDLIAVATGQQAVAAVLSKEIPTELLKSLNKHCCENVAWISHAWMEYVATVPQPAAAPSGDVPDLSFLEPLYRWMARAQFARPIDEITAARFAQQMRAAITAIKE